MLNEPEIIEIIERALHEDIGSGDITSNLLIEQTQQGTMNFVAREEMVACGLFIAGLVYARLGSIGSVSVQVAAQEGKQVVAGTTLLSATGSARALLAGERVALNLMQRMCGIATLTHSYTQAVKGTWAVILDTRKTMPGLRVLDKYSVVCGGGQNHRMRLDDMVLIKDNHIALCGGIIAAVQRARAGTTLPVVIECDTLEQVKQAIEAKPERILLDNMPPSMLKQAVALAAGRVKLEASGGVSLGTVRAIAESGVGYISVGKLTHSAPAADIGADIAFSH